MKQINQIRILSLVVVMVAAAIGFGLASRSGVNAQDKKQTQQKQDPQKPPKKDEELQTLKIGTQLVNVLFSVQDKQNRYLNELTQEDIVILENGQPQEVFAFKKEFDLPLTMAILVDVSGSEQYTLPLLKEAGGRFIDSVIRFGKDTAAVLKFEGETTIMQDLSSNPARIRRGLDQIEFTAPPPAGVFGGATPPINGGSRQGGTSMYDAIVATSADMLARQPGRKTIILITDGEDTTSRMKIGDAIDEALKAEVVIYAIGIGDYGRYGVNEGALKKICDATGGRAIIPKSNRDMEDAFAQLERDLRQQYLLAYEPKNDLADGSFRKLEIKLKTKTEKEMKELKVRHRKGYYAPKG
jgi:VWFA-related protein